MQRPSLASSSELRVEIELHDVDAWRWPFDFVVGHVTQPHPRVARDAVERFQCPTFCVGSATMEITVRERVEHRIAFDVTILTHDAPLAETVDIVHPDRELE